MICKKYRSQSRGAGVGQEGVGVQGAMRGGEASQERSSGIELKAARAAISRGERVIHVFTE